MKSEEAAPKSSPSTATQDRSHRLGRIARASQKGRILAALEEAGADGVATIDFLAPRVIDGGSPIIRVPARIDELRNKHGHHIDMKREPNGTARYFLRKAAPVRQVQHPQVVEPPSLFEVAAPPAYSPYDRRAA